MISAGVNFIQGAVEGTFGPFITSIYPCAIASFRE